MMRGNLSVGDVDPAAVEKVRECVNTFGTSLEFLIQRHGEGIALNGLISLYINAVCLLGLEDQAIAGMTDLMETLKRSLEARQDGIGEPRGRA